MLSVGFLCVLFVKHLLSLSSVVLFTYFQVLFCAVGLVSYYLGSDISLSILHRLSLSAVGLMRMLITSVNVVWFALLNSLPSHPSPAPLTNTRSRPHVEPAL